MARPNISTTVMGVSAEYLEVRSWPLDSGVNFTDSDIRSSAKLVLLGQTAATNLFGATNPVGKTIRIRGAPFRVLGLLSAKGLSMVGQDQDDIVLTRIAHKVLMKGIPPSLASEIGVVWGVF